jgi:hypothetical protein
MVKKAAGEPELRRGQGLDVTLKAVKGMEK